MSPNLPVPLAIDMSWARTSVPLSAFGSLHHTSHNSYITAWRSVVLLETMCRVTIKNHLSGVRPPGCMRDDAEWVLRIDGRLCTLVMSSLAFCVPGVCACVRVCFPAERRRPPT